MSESQNIEWKQSWHDDYLKWVCGFANAFGGTICIGKNDAGEIVHVENYIKLLEEIPNRIRNSMGIICDLNLVEESGKKWIELKVNPYAVPVSLRGRYYYRSGSTKMELTGLELNEFLLKKAGKTWDDVVEDGATLADIDTKSIHKFIEDSKDQGRLPDTSGLTTLQILNKLRLVKENKLKRAALILFGKDPGRFFNNISVKIGRFGSDGSDLKFQEVLEGNLVYLLNEVWTQLNYKFLTRPVDFEGMHRIEKGEYPLSALREMLLNALVHKSYVGAAVQLRVFDYKLSIWNEGLLPQGLDIDSLKSNHNSRPRNPKIADACFKAGYIDAWGRGTLKIISACKEAELPEPEIIEKEGGVQVTIFKAILPVELIAVGPMGGPIGGPIGGPMGGPIGGPIEEQVAFYSASLSKRQLEVLEIIKANTKISRRKLAEQLNINVSAVQGHLDLLKEKGVLSRKGGTRGIWVILENN
jgi:ATP-dependent DNA helicase RecG